MLKNIPKIIISLFIILHFSSASAVSKNEIPKKKWTQAGLYLNTTEANAELKSNAKSILFLDVRTRGEVAYTGMATPVDFNIPLKFTSKKYQWSDKKGHFKMTPNSKFVANVLDKLKLKGLTKNNKVFIMCRSGARSAKAADLLTKAGFTQVFSVIDGFEGDTVKSGVKKGKRTLNGWKNNNLPWSFKLDKKKMYLVNKADEKDNQSKMLKKMDINNDNRVSQSEFDNFHKNKFSKIDKNNNGILDEQELKDFKALKKQEKKQAKK